jgi:hypothetical protein
VRRSQAQYGSPAPWPARRPALRVTTGLALSAAGAILLLAVHVRLSFLSIPVTGLILLVTGLMWLWIPVRRKRELIGRCFSQVMGYLQWEAASLSGTRSTLTEMLADPAIPADPGGGPPAMHLP